MIDHAGPCSRESACSGCRTEHLMESLTAAVRAIAHGPTSGPTGLEALAMSICGGGTFDTDNLSQAVRDAGAEIGNALRAVAEAIAGAR
jgi:hypothetical protein